ncbi:hypothetical protein KR767_18640 [Luteibacter anthropi]|uniref:hypothetical protein n=1 Tax=Luteibacter anthropi TaxID=564369 RepID=UPI002032430B|nr:hypothetical protein [Luteibacter anthropi]URX62039.1 hypothetical protein KR767_18640 [Luteibacter anthropi]
MNDFINRVDTLRQVLNLVNSRVRGQEELFGLSEKAISRWEAVNGIDPAQSLSTCLRELAMALQTLANKSQESVTDEYRTKAFKVYGLTEKLRLKLDW